MIWGNRAQFFHFDMRILSGCSELQRFSPRVDGLLEEYEALYEKFRVSSSEVSSSSFNHGSKFGGLPPLALVYLRNATLILNPNPDSNKGHIHNSEEGFMKFQLKNRHDYNTRFHKRKREISLLYVPGRSR
ncbi:hypothetical protein TNCV_604201 [Trichonephila clavipes]|nr:hypothetical protein TNCV_604201 [Trichonephila clavipes]